MDTVKVEINIPSDVLAAAKIKKRHANIELTRELAIHLFEQAILSLGKASQLANMSRADFMVLLSKRKIPLHYSINDYKKDIATLKKLRK